MTGGKEHGLDYVHRAALEAVRTGGALHINRRGRIAVVGRHVFGRTALRVKQYLLPHRMRRQNRHVLNLCAAAIRTAMKNAPTPSLSTYTRALAQTLGHESRLAHILVMKIQLCLCQLNALRENRASAERIFNTLLHASAPIARRHILQSCGCAPDALADLPVLKSRYKVFITRLGHRFMSETAFPDEFLKEALRVVVQKNSGRHPVFQKHVEPTWLTRAYDASFPPSAPAPPLKRAA